MPSLPSVTWLRHAALLRELALTGPAQHHVYRKAAEEAVMHTEAGRLSEAALPAIEASILAEAA